MTPDPQIRARRLAAQAGAPAVDVPRGTTGNAAVPPLSAPSVPSVSTDPWRETLFPIDEVGYWRIP